jgi:hypothetical protein
LLKTFALNFNSRRYATDNHIFGKTYGTATTLAPAAEATMKDGGNASAMAAMVETRPIGNPDLYAQSHTVGQCRLTL